MQQKYILGVLLYLLIIGCTSENPSTENTENTDNNSESLFLKLITDYSPKFQKIIGLQKNAFRGVNLGMTKEEVMQIETAKQDEIDEEAGVIRYVVDFSLKENVDIEYYFSSENKLSKIDVTFYANSMASQDSLWTQFIEYYDIKLGKHQKNPKGFFWLHHQKDSLILQKVGNEHYPNLMFQIK